MVYRYNIPEGSSPDTAKVGDLWKGFREDTTAHGIPHVSNAPGKCKKVFWLLISVMACAVLIFHLYSLVTTFMKFNTTVKLSLLQEYETDFPAVTICNMNPIKQSALHLDSVLEELLSDDTRRRKRKKRFLEFPCTGDQVYEPLGLCYAVIDIMQKQDDAKGDCADQESNLYMPLNADIESFIAQSPIFDGVSFDKYWIYMRNEQWGDRVPPEYLNYYTSYGNENAAIAVISENHRWAEYHKDETDVGVLCQKMIECPNPVFLDANGTSRCWFMPYGESEVKWEDAKHACKKFATSAFLVELDTQAKFQFLTNAWGILDTVTGNSYWLGLKMDGDREWLESQVDVETTWNNWDTSSGEPSNSHQGVVADIDNNHLWRTEEHNDDSVTAMIICEITDLQYNGYYVPSSNMETTLIETTTDSITTFQATTTDELTTELDTTTIDETTIIITTTVEDTTTESITTDIDTTIEESTTIHQTTYEETLTPDITTEVNDLTSMHITTVQDTTTRDITTESDTTVGQSTTAIIPTDQYTTNQDQSDHITTELQTTSDSISVGQDVTTSGAVTTLHTTTHYITTEPVASTTTQPSSIEGRPPLRENFVLAETVIENLAMISEDTKRAMGYNANEFILDCQYEGWQCDSSMFYQIYDPIFGNCYMFNSGWNRSVSVQKSHRTGRRYGLSLVLNIAENEYLSNIGGASGARVVVHHQHSMPHPDEEGILAQPGQLTSIGAQKVIYKKKPAPYGKCTMEKKNHETDVYGEKYKHVHYSKKNCFRTCYQRHVISRCDCADSYYPMEGEALGASGRIRPCDTTDSTQDDCRFLVNRDYVAGKLGCSKQCPDPCKDKYFDTTISTALWPSRSHRGSIEDQFGEQIPDIVYSNDSDAIWKNLLNVEVFYNDFNYEKITEKETYKTEQFMSDLGGILGLWIGCSVITIFEFFELGMDLVVLGCCNALTRCRKSAKRQTFGGGCEPRNQTRKRSAKIKPVSIPNPPPAPDNAPLRRQKRKSCSTPPSTASSGFFDENNQENMPGVPDSPNSEKDYRPTTSTLDKHSQLARPSYYRPQNKTKPHTPRSITTSFKFPDAPTTPARPRAIPSIRQPITLIDESDEEYVEAQTPSSVNFGFAKKSNAFDFSDEETLDKWWREMRQQQGIIQAPQK